MTTTTTGTGRHTPGPWHNRHWNGAGQVQISAVTMATLATVEARRDEAGQVSPAAIDEAEANARLIAAAPDLLAACQWAKHYCEDAKKAAWDDTAAVPLACAITQLHAAIAKALGVVLWD